MARNIAVADDVYEKLKKLKRKNESFSDVIRRLLPPQGRLSQLAGTKTFTKEEWQQVSEVFANKKILDEKRKQELMQQIREE